METAQKIRPRDVLSYLGRDYLVEGVLTYRLDGKAYPLARAVDGDVVLWVEPLTDDLDDRLILLTEVRDLEIMTPPPSSIVYRKSTFVPRFSGKATVEVAGQVPGHTGGAVELWRYRAAGDLYLQIEARASGPFVLHGESVHKGMIDVLPGT
jgi:hypothetical protein